MKKFLGIISLATIALAGCTKTDVEVAAPSTVAKTIYASVNTKTVNDGLSTKWAKDDAISVFFAEEGDDAYSENTKFEISDIESGAFTGTAPTLEEGVAYDWFAYYPYTSQIETPANTNTGYMTVGSRSNSSQIQQGNSSKAHLAGANYPLIGKATSVPAEDDVVFQMEQAAAVVAINVTNSASADLQVSNVQFTAEEDIVGTYYINIAGDEPIYTGSGASYVSNTAKLSVENGEVLTSGESATFYIAVKPFTATTGQTLKISVNGYEKTITLTKDVTFARGVIKTVNFNYDEEIVTIDEPDGTVPGWYRVKDVAWLSAGDRVIVAAVVDGETAPTLSVTQNTNNRAATNPVDVTLGDVYASATPIAATQIFVLEAAENGTFAFKCENGDQAGQYIYGADSQSNVLKSKEEVDGSASWEVIINNGVAALTAQGASTRNHMRYNSSSKLFSCYTSGQEDIALYKNYGDALLACEAPSISCDKNTVYITATTEGSTVYYTVDGTTPTTESILYTEPFAITANTTIKAIAVKEGLADSKVATIETEYEETGEILEYSLEILPSAFNTTSYAANNGSHSFTAVCTTDETKTITVECTTNQIMLQTNLMQWQKNNGYVYNNTNLGTIKSVTVTSTAGDFTTYYGKSVHPTSGVTVGDGYFTISVGGATGKTSSVKVVFEK